jgi:PAS domain S-box-containing protein
MEHDSFKLYQEVFSHFPLALGLLDENDHILFANDGFATLCGASQEAVCGRKIGQVLPLPGLQTLLATCHGQLSEASVSWQSKQQQTRQGEFPLTTTPGGEVSMVKVTLTPLSPNGETDVPMPSPSVFLLLLEDISEKVRWEEQLLQAEKLSGMTELAATLAHELGNPLGIISSTLQYMQTQLSNNQFHEEIEVIIDQVEQMHGLLRTLTDGIRPAEPRFSHERVDHIFAQVLTFIAKEAEKHRVHIQTDFAPELSPCLVDSRQLKQVFLNLCKNALEAMPEGGTLTVAIYPCETGPSSVGARPCAPTTGEVVIEVKDTGGGIPPEDIERIWKPFYSTKAGGRGLGLSLSRRVIEQHGGHINVCSVYRDWSMYRQGTTFRIFLPYNPKKD